MTVEEASGPPVEIWPDNLAAVNLFISMGTQWRVGAAGATGLDYNVMYRKMDRMDLTPEQYDDLEQDIGLMEDEALTKMYQK